MIFRHAGNPEKNSGTPGVRPAFQVFLETQKNTGIPYGVILQPNHSKLAGDIATHLLPDVFGELPPDVVAAIREHDFGWQESDDTQLRNMAKDSLRPFPKLSPEESLPAWHQSVQRAKGGSALKGIIVSRHFCALAEQDPAHQRFAEEENPRREEIEKRSGFSSADLDRWTGAIGFCDLVSLYLCSGSQESAEFPLAHPALPASRSARKLFLEWADGQCRFTSPVLQEGGTFSVGAHERPDKSPNLRPLDLSWRFVH